jgi:LPS sulfotransferase NodH
METTTTTNSTTEWSTLHIFGYGETQLIGKDLNKKVPTLVLTTVQAVIDNVYSFKPEGNTATEQYHAINIFNNMFADWQTAQQGVEGWRVQYPELDATLIDALVAEIIAYVQPTAAN